MKKRVVALLLALVVLCTGVMLTACGGNEAPPETVAKKSVADVINEAMKKTGALDEMSAVMKMEMNMAAEGMTMSIPITAKMKAKDLGGRKHDHVCGNDYVYVWSGHQYRDVPGGTVGLCCHG